MKRILLLSILIFSVGTALAVDYETEIQPIWNANCMGCHGTQGGLNLADGQSFANLVDVEANGYPGVMRVASGDPSTSVLYNKVANTGVNGGVMPQGGSLTAEQIALISTWITELADTTPITIAEARVMAEDTQVTIQGIITATTWGIVGTTTQAAIQDDTGGMVIYAGGFDAGFVVGDEVIVTGVIDIYAGLIEVTPSSPTDIEILSSGNALPAIQNLTVPEILANGEDYESEFVHLANMTIIGGTWPTPGSSSQNMTISDENDVTMTMRIDSDTDLLNHPAMLGNFNLTAIVGRYNDVFQVFPRYYSDLEQIGDPTPQISNVVQDPASPLPTDDVTVTATIIDNSAVASASISYVVNSGVEMVVVMTAGENSEFTGIIPAQEANAIVSYTIWATDDLGGMSASNEYSYTVYGGVLNSISSIQDGTVNPGAIVTIQGIVTAEPYAFHAEGALQYYYIQDDYAALSGIKILDPGRGLEEGDQVRLSGFVIELSGMTAIEDITEFELLDTDIMVEPLTISLGGDLEIYEGCLIEINDVMVSNPDLGSGEWSVSDGTNEIRIGNAADYFYTAVNGEGLSSIVGVLDYSGDNFKIQPRLAIDLQTADGFTRIQAIQQVRYSDLMPKYSSLDNSVWFADTSYYHEAWSDTTIVTVRGIVSMPTGITYAGNGIKFILQDVNGGPWSSILSYNPDSTAYPVLFEGDLIELSGRIVEFDTHEGTNVSNMTELWITQEIDIIDIGLDLPPEPVVTTGDLRWPTTAEQWGNVIVTVENATIIENDPTLFDMLSIDDGSGSVLVDDDSRFFRDWTQGYPGPAVYIQPPAGSIYDEVRGWVYHHYGSYADSTTYKLVPLYQSDMVLSASAIDNLVVPEGYALGNYPNPFNPTTNIAFRIPEAQQVQLVIYNQRGQHVTTLVDQSLNAGEYQVVWNGLNQKGRPVSSGLYFYRMVAGKEQMAGKMTYLK
ncbi:MAG: T9SS type A sorting domain-containing protein [Candidatus Marinimicrobia bacterium]|nr:T9SS type A sorting domain-containing protein [FCB group bacterium]MBL7025637.1 T9SS type A sorting domain-containing protein [Candidatus Neomarinimicrobiota bacterium]